MDLGILFGDAPRHSLAPPVICLANQAGVHPGQVCMQAICLANFNQIYPNQAIAICTREQADQLANYDRHLVNVNGRARVMLTYEWTLLEEHTGPFALTVVFRYAEKHPPAPEKIQTIVDGLRFQVRGQAR